MLNLAEYRRRADRLADHLPWAALVALDDYAARRARGAFSGSFYQWCSEPPSGAAAISAAAVAMGERQPAGRSFTRAP